MFLVILIVLVMPFQKEAIRIILTIVVQTHQSVTAIILITNIASMVIIVPAILIMTMIVILVTWTKEVVIAKILTKEAEIAMNVKLNSIEEAMDEKRDLPQHHEINLRKIQNADQFHQQLHLHQHQWHLQEKKDQLVLHQPFIL